MLEKHLQTGMAANWLPTSEGGKGGTGKELSDGVIHVRDNTALYLPFVANGINYVDSQGKDVISYNFTGCIMATYTVGGARRVCHVSTGGGQDCKAEWDRIKRSATGVIAFRPDLGADIAQLGKLGQAFNCYGLITATGECYSVMVGGLVAGAGSQKPKMIMVLSCTRITQFLP